MIFLNIVSQVVLLVWIVLTIRTIIRILRFSRPAWKGNWYWFADKSSYYKGLGFGLLWGLGFGIPAVLIGPVWYLISFTLQALIAYLFLKDKSASNLEKNIWVSMPFFMLPLWMACRQGQKNGELPAA